MIAYGQEAAGYECANRECHAKGADERVAFFTLLLAVVTGLLFVATYALWRATLGAVRDAARVSDRQACEFQQSLAETRKGTDALRTMERAHVHFEVIRNNLNMAMHIISPIEEGPPEVELRIANLGRTPAFIVSARRGITINGAPAGDRTAENLDVAEEMLAGGARSEPHTARLVIDRGADRIGIITGERELRFQATVVYDDIFGDRWCERLDCPYEPEPSRLVIRRETILLMRGNNQ